MRKFFGTIKTLGPGIAVAATGVGAGDMVAATVAGSRYGMAVVWVIAVGAFLKYFLNEGLSRWQLATGTTLLEGWFKHFGKAARVIFLLYLVIWSFIVGGALVSACGLGAHALIPSLSVKTWGIIHSLLGLIVVFVGSYGFFESLMKVFIGFMFVSFILCAAWVAPPALSLYEMVAQASIPVGSGAFLLGVMGGVGGSLTLLVYGYWMREKKWTERKHLPLVRTDLKVAYLLTGLFGVSLMVVAAKVLLPQGMSVSGGQGVIQMASALTPLLGKKGEWIFLLGFWGAVTTSLFGVWQSVPYLFCDYLQLSGLMPETREFRKSSPYRLYVLYLAIAPLSLLFFEKPVFVILLYSVVGSLFMPLLAGSLLYLNGSKKRVGEMTNSPLVVSALALTVLLYGWISANSLIDALRSIS